MQSLLKPALGPSGEANAGRQVLLVQNDAAYRVALACQLRRARMNVVDVSTTMHGLDLLDSTPDLRCAIVAADMRPNTLSAVSFARMMKHRYWAAQILLLVERQADVPVLDGPDADLFDGIILKNADLAPLAKNVLSLFGLDTCKLDRTGNPF